MRYLTLLLALLLVGCSRPPHPRVVVFGFDGCDPVVTTQLMQDGRLPNFSRLGKLRSLATSNPPQSPVAWSTFITGTNPGGHGIFDFLHRDPHSLTIVPSMTTVVNERSQLQRGGTPFWVYLEQAGVPCTLIKVPANFPPQATPGRLLTGMGTPDLEGSYGTFTYYTEADEQPPDELSGGRFVPVAERDGQIRASLIGPEDDSVPLTIRRGKTSIVLEFQQQRRLLQQGEWTDWIPVDFPRASGIARFYLKSATPLRLYSAPINLDPCRPAQPISSPASFARHLCRCCDRFYTQGMAEDTKALTHGVLEDAEFLSQSELVLEERKRLLRQSLKEFEEGLLFFYLSTTDIHSHLYWATLDRDHPGYNEARSRDYHGVIEKAYVEADALLGEALEQLGEETSFVVLSDHGFAPFYRAFNLNGWLRENGFLVGGERGLSDIDWSRTRAYGVGFNGLYLNLAGRESQGIVSQADRAALLDQLVDGLKDIRDNGKPVLRRVFQGRQIYTGAYRDQGPDLVLGYARGFRASWETVLGQAGGPILSDNTELWSGDHLMDPEVVPGILLTNLNLSERPPTLVDLAPTLLDLFGVQAGVEMSGQSLLKP